MIGDNIVAIDRYYVQYVVAVFASVSQFSVGIAVGWSSPTIPKLIAANSPIPITADQGSWLIQVPVIGMWVTSYISSWTNERLSVRSLLIGVLAIVASWIAVIFANSVAAIFVARAIVSLAYGFIYTVLPIYLGEIASDKIRGFIITMQVVMSNMGVLFVFSIAPFISIFHMALIAIVPPAIFVASFLWLPESPYYLIGKNRSDDAKQSLIRLRGHCNVKAELDRMTVAVMKSDDNKGMFRELLATHNRKGQIIILIMAAIGPLCGSTAIIDYSQTIFSKFGSSLSAVEATILMGGCQLLAAVMGNSLVDVIGRKSLLLISAAGTAICTSCVGLYFFLERHSFDVSNLGWLPITALMVFQFAFNIGLATVTFALLGEILPKHLKSVVGATYLVLSGLVDGSVSKLFQTISDNVGSDVSFWLFAGFSYAFIVFVVFVVPETKGKPLEVILEDMRSKGIVVTKF